MHRWTTLTLLALAVLLYVVGFTTESLSLGAAALVFEAAFWSRLFKRTARDRRP